MVLFLGYLRAVMRHWVALMTGSFLVAAYEILVAAYPDSPTQSHSWNHLPVWLVWSLVLLGVVLAQYLAWRDMRAERDASVVKAAQLQAQMNQLKDRRVAFTSNGLAWSTQTVGIQGSKYLVTLAIAAHPSELEQLPQPLSVVVECSEPPAEAIAQFFDSEMVGKSRHYEPIHPELKDSSVHIHLREPKLMPPAILLVFLRGGPSLAVLSVTRPSVQ